MDGEARFTVVVVNQFGARDVRASGLTLETAQAVRVVLVPIFPQARVLIEPPPQMMDGHHPDKLTDMRSNRPRFMDRID